MPATFETPTCALRFIERVTAVPLPNRPDISQMRSVRILQQRWDIYDNGLPAVTRSEWRDVPLEVENACG